MSRRVYPWKYAELNGKSVKQVMRMLYEDRIEGAEKILHNGHRVWAIPEDSPWPKDKRFKRTGGYIDE